MLDSLLAALRFTFQFCNFGVFVDAEIELVVEFLFAAAFVVPTSDQSARLWGKIDCGGARLRDPAEDDNDKIFFLLPEVLVLGQWPR